MEILDIVDDTDRVVGSGSRSDIHAKGLMHRAAHMLLFNHRNQLFFQKRSLSKDNDPGLWDSSAAGHVDSGENYLECAVREISEELGIVVDPDSLVQEFKLPPIVETGMEFAMVYTLVNGQTLQLDPIEIIGGKWLDPDAVDVWVDSEAPDLTYGFSLIWKTLRAGR